MVLLVVFAVTIHTFHVFIFVIHISLCYIITIRIGPIAYRLVHRSFMIGIGSCAAVEAVALSIIHEQRKPCGLSVVNVLM